MLALLAGVLGTSAAVLTGIPEVFFTLAICFPATFKARSYWVLAATAISSPITYSSHLRMAEWLRFEPDTFLSFAWRELAAFIIWALLVTAIRGLLTPLLRRK